MKTAPTPAVEHNSKNQKKTSLDNFQLFYEEIPLEVAKANQHQVSRPKDRLERRSRLR